MPTDVLDELRAENPLPELLPGLPVEVIRRRLEEEPSARTRPVVPSRPAFRLDAFVYAFAVACVLAAVVFAVSNSLPASSPGGFSVAYAQAAIGRGEQALSAHPGSFLYTDMVQTHSGPGQRASREVQRLWVQAGGRRGDQWRAYSSGVPVTDVALVGGIAEYYVPARNTIYVDRPPALSSIAGLIPDPDPVELAIGALLNVEPPGRAAGGFGVGGAVRRLMALPGARVSRSGGSLSVTVSRAGHLSTIAVHPGSHQPVFIRQVSPDPAGSRTGYVNTFRFFAYDRRVPNAVAAKALDLPRVYPTAKVRIIHRSALNIP